MLKDSFFLGEGSNAASPFQSAAAGSNVCGNNSKYARPTEPGSITDFKGVELKKIAEAYVKSMWGDPVPEGSRHEAVFETSRLLAGAIGSDVDSIAWALTDVATSYPDEEWWRDVREGSTKYRYSVCTKALRNVVESLGGVFSQPTVRTSTSEKQGSQQSIDKKTAQTTGKDASIVDLSGLTQAVPFPDLTYAPKFLKVVCSHFDERLHHMILNNALVAGPGMQNEKVKFIDGSGLPVYPNLEIFNIGEFASGKSAATKLLDILLKPKRDEDKAARKLYEQYRSQKQSANGTKTIQNKPKIFVSTISPSTTRLQLLEYLDVADERPLLMWTEELTESVNANRSAWNCGTLVLRLGFDSGILSNDSLSDISINGSAVCRLNTVMNSQFNVFFRWLGDSGIEDGTASRILVNLMQSTLGQSRLQYKPWKQDELDFVYAELDRIKKECKKPQEVDLKQTRAMLDSILQQLNDEYNSKSEHTVVDKLRLQLSYRMYEIALRLASHVWLIERKETTFLLSVAKYYFWTGLTNLFSLIADRVDTLETQRRINDNFEKLKKINLSDIALSKLNDQFTKDELSKAVAEAGMKSGEDNIRLLIHRMSKAKKIKKVAGQKDVYKKIK